MTGASLPLSTMHSSGEALRTMETGDNTYLSRGQYLRLAYYLLRFIPSQSLQNLLDVRKLHPVLRCPRRKTQAQAGSRSGCTCQQEQMY